MSRDSSSIPTIYDVAKQSGVSISTVSRVLNNRRQVSAESRARVLDAIQELSFVPRAEARARALSRMGRIGVITPFFTAPSFVQRLQGVAEALKSTSYELVIYTVDSYERLKGYLTNLPITHAVDGLIMMSLLVSEEDVQRLVQFHMKTVLIEYHQSGLSSVEIDNAAGGRMAADYLLKKGHRRFGFLGDSHLPEYTIYPVRQRLAGFRDRLAEVGIELLAEVVRLSRYTQLQSRQAARELLALNPRPTAIFAATDYQAVGVLKVAREMGLQVPGDLAVIGFDDLELAEITGLTTITQHLEESGRIAAEMLLNCVEHPNRPPKRVELPLKVIERETT